MVLIINYTNTREITRFQYSKIMVIVRFKRKKKCVLLFSLEVRWTSLNIKIDNFTFNCELFDQQIPEEGWRAQQLKHCDNNKDKDISSTEEKKTAFHWFWPGPSKKYLCNETEKYNPHCKAADICSKQPKNISMVPSSHRIIFWESNQKKAT